VVEQLAEAGIEARNLSGGMAAWADVYRRAEIADGATEATVYQYRRPATGCLGYAVVDGGEAAIVDPLAAFVDRYVADAAALGAEIVAVVDTHVHADHVSGLRSLAEAAGVTPSVPAAAVERGIEYEVDALADGDALAVGDAELEARASPGHTTGSASLLVDGVLLAGDSLFLDGVARPDLETGADGAREMAATLYDTLHDRVLALPDDVRVAPGHVASHTPAADDDTYTATVGALRERVAALSLDRAAFVERVGTDLPERPANVERIIETNLGRDDPDDETAFELELGPNNCAAGSAD
jgi:glyoxylase-like metal-dependent hydrolase (beta-lactamase superfamily II)